MRADGVSERGSLSPRSRSGAGLSWHAQKLPTAIVCWGRERSDGCGYRIVYLMDLVLDRLYGGNNFRDIHSDNCAADGAIHNMRIFIRYFACGWASANPS